MMLKLLAIALIASFSFATDSTPDQCREALEPWTDDIRQLSTNNRGEVDPMRGPWDDENRPWYRPEREIDRGSAASSNSEFGPGAGDANSDLF